MKFAIVPGSKLGTANQIRSLVKSTLSLLRSSVPSLGFLQCIAAVITPAGLQTLYGFHRRHISEELGIDVPCMIYPEGLSRAKIIQMQMVENNTRSKMNICEKADCLAMYMADTGLTATAAGRELDMHPSEVSSVLTCQQHLASEVLFKLSNANIGYSIAAELAKTDHPTQMELLPRVLDKSLTRAELAKIVRTPTTKHYRLTFTTPVSYDDLVAQLTAVSTKLKTMQKQNIPFDLARKALD